jgi:hypothetical protein
MLEHIISLKSPLMDMYTRQAARQDVHLGSLLLLLHCNLPRQMYNV